MYLQEIINATNAEVISKNKVNPDVKISTDTRSINNGDFYLPLKGQSFDGENFIQQAFEKGACGAFITKYPKFSIGDTDKILLKVPDTLTAYLQLANFRRNKINPVVVAITGSSGKTTTKEIVASVLSAKYKTFKTPLNHNNEIGFCQTIFEMPDDTEMLVLEMGMRGLGEIELLSKYSEPDITIIANVGTAHIGRLGSKENIAKAKCEIVYYQRGDIFIAHNDELIKNTVNFDKQKMFYSINDVNVLERQSNYSRFEYKDNIYELNVGGDYNIENSLAAINCGFALNMTTNQIQSGLKNYHPIEKRWELTTVNGFKIINDSYNANPDSMKAFINTVLDLYPDYTLVLGDMGELGENETEYHKEVGRYIDSHKKLNKNSLVISVGTLSENITDEIKNCYTKHFPNIDTATDYIKKNVKKDSVIFLKASRSMKFEKIIEALNF